MAKILLEANDIIKAFGDRTVLEIGQLHLYDGERVALIGENGAGKSTLLAILAGELAPDRGTVRRYCPIASIHQSGEARLDGDPHISARFRAPDSRQGLSGGEQTRRRIAQALSAGAPLLLADEPTTDLDAEGVERLTRQLRAYRGALVLVSHDQALLNALCTRVLHLEDGRITDFPGSYAQYRLELDRRRQFQQFEYDQYRAEQARLKAQMQKKAEWAASVHKAPKRMGNSEARLHTREYTNAVLRQSAAKRAVQDRLERLEKKERPRDLPDIRMALGSRQGVRAKTMLAAQVDVLSAGGRTLLADTRFSVPTGSKTALTGVNGSGKTTLLRALRGELSPGVEFRGDVHLAPGARIGWFDQDHARALCPEASALENARGDANPPEALARTVLARLGLRGDDVFKPVRVLSGGERAKIALARLLLGDNDLLILDEPTNHLDIFTMEALGTLLKGFAGTLLFVSHDRAFVSAVADRLLLLRDGQIETFEGTLAQREAEEKRDREAEALQLELSTLEMRMASLAARLSAPRKGDRPDALNAEYRALAARLREMKGRS